MGLASGSGSRPSLHLPATTTTVTKSKRKMEEERRRGIDILPNSPGGSFVQRHFQGVAELVPLESLRGCRDTRADASRTIDFFGCRSAVGAMYKYGVKLVCREGTSKDGQG
ncbi:hypothetical protein AYO20_02298 [Fonsecaea nubica]|uniref:Uncharacterized protein n=1 Tax=Fonsecaea nubica TaxID=856822 RepID=A0A178D7W6_9EURO|nr:hypothetical protein AYO20_02298 [Fonsecaea nubica]OAL38239.1 hypothetical protein AYO20_02298 [Fonsecaea nubica]